MTKKNALEGTTVWIIGASDGIGAATAREMAARGAQVTISARREVELEKVASGTDMRVLPLDATDAAAVGEAWSELSGADAPEIVLYAAGYWEQTEAGTFDPEAFARHVDVNLLGMGHVLGAVVEPFVARGHGRIAVVASVAGYRGLPGGEYYGATKAAQINLLEALRGSLSARGVSVTTICPGFVDTEMTRGNDFPMPFMVSAEHAAREICDGLAAGHHEITFPLPMAAAMKAGRLLPGRAWDLLVARSGR